MYKYTLKVKERATGTESTYRSNNLNRLKDDINQCSGIAFVISETDTHKIIMRGNK